MIGITSNILGSEIVKYLAVAKEDMYSYIYCMLEYVHQLSHAAISEKINRKS